MVHWSSFPPAMAYVMLGRVENLLDLHIVGDFNPKQIRTDKEAKIVTERLNEIAHQREALEQELHESSTVLASLNVRSLRNHCEDVGSDPFIMKADIIGLCETWLKEDEKVEFPGYNGIFVSYPGDLAKGKGIAVFTKEPLDYDALKVEDASASAVCVKHEELDVIFLYLSKDFDWQIVCEFLETVIDPMKPTIIMGDMNWHYPDDHPMKNYLDLKDFTQLISRATHERGRCIDHLYVSRHYGEDEVGFKQQSVPYSDHDLITAFVPK